MQKFTMGLIILCFKVKMDLSIYDKATIKRGEAQRAGLSVFGMPIPEGERWVHELGKLEDHIIRTHIHPERIPYFCQLCKFK